jgi:hypothetical protein
MHTEQADRVLGIGIYTNPNLDSELKQYFAEIIDLFNKKATKDHYACTYIFSTTLVNLTDLFTFTFAASLALQHPKSDRS